MLYLIGTLLIIIGFLVYKLFKKQKIDKIELEFYQKELNNHKAELRELETIISAENGKLKEVRMVREHIEKVSRELEEKITQAENRYDTLINVRMKEIDKVAEETGNQRMNELEKTFDEAKAKYNLQLVAYEQEQKQRMMDIHASCIETNQRNLDETQRIKEETDKLRTTYESLLEPIRQYLKEKQEKLFYTIQLPDEYKDDIDFLLTTVAAKVQHPDIISKLVWAEYVKPNLDNTFKRIEIKSDSGIYKLTSLENGMTYIGKSTDVKKRIADHFKSSIGIKSIADQAVHHAILKEGFWNWTIEVIQYCDKDELNEKEKYYIEFFKAQEYGYNKTGGG